MTNCYIQDKPEWMGRALKAFAAVTAGAAVWAAAGWWNSETAHEPVTLSAYSLSKMKKLSPPANKQTGPVTNPEDNIRSGLLPNAFYDALDKATAAADQAEREAEEEWQRNQGYYEHKRAIERDREASEIQKDFETFLQTRPTATAQYEYLAVALLSQMHSFGVSRHEDTDTDTDTDNVKAFYGRFHQIARDAFEELQIEYNRGGQNLDERINMNRKMQWIAIDCFGSMSDPMALVYMRKRTMLWDQEQDMLRQKYVIQSQQPQ